MTRKSEHHSKLHSLPYLRALALGPFNLSGDLDLFSGDLCVFLSFLFSSSFDHLEGAFQSALLVFNMTTSNGISAATKTVVDKSSKAIGIIGMGEMGKLYARRFGAAGWRYVT